MPSRWKRSTVALRGMQALPSQGQQTSLWHCRPAAQTCLPFDSGSTRNASITFARRANLAVALPSRRSDMSPVRQWLYEECKHYLRKDSKPRCATAVPPLRHVSPEGIQPGLAMNIGGQGAIIIQLVGCELESKCIALILCDDVRGQLGSQTTH